MNADFRILGIWVGLVCAVLAGCRFSPSVDGAPLTGCSKDADCPRGAACAEQTCVPRPVKILSLTAEPAVVDAGASCTVSVEATYAAAEENLRYRWRQVVGPRVTLGGVDTPQASLTTEAGYIGSYVLEVEVSSDRTEPAVGRVTCTALVRDQAAYVVPGHAGDCTEQSPCGSMETAAEILPNATRVYLGVDGGADGVFTFGGHEWTYDWQEVHGGFLFPGWQRAPERARTAIGSLARGLSLSCSDCTITGLFHSAPADSEHDTLVSISGTNVTIRECTFHLGETLTANTHSNYGMSISHHASNVLVESTRIVAQGGGDGVPESVFGISIEGGGVVLRDVSVDLLAGRAAVSKTGIRIHMQYGASPSPTLDRVDVRLGGVEATSLRESTALRVSCGTPTVWRSVFDARGGFNHISWAVALHGESYCLVGGSIHASLLIAGEGREGRVLDLSHLTDPPPTLRNNILDAGDAGLRIGVFLEHEDGRLSAQSGGNVLVFEGGQAATDTLAMIADDVVVSTDALGEALGCPSCFSQAETAGHRARDEGDFHLTSESESCGATGTAIIQSLDPPTDRDGTAWGDPPSVGPYQLIP